jgi:hypothetical protein
LTLPPKPPIKIITRQRNVHHRDTSFNNDTKQSRIHDTKHSASESDL